MKIYSVTDDRNFYYSQRNNVLKPTIRCKNTATIEGLDIAGWRPLPGGSYAQPEDNLTDYIERTYGPDAPEDWNFVVKAVNEYFYPGQNPCSLPRWNWDVREALFGIINRIPFIASTKLTYGGHVVALLRFGTNQVSPIRRPADIDLAAVVSFGYDDPYGNINAPNGYKSGESGFNCWMAKDKFLQVWKNTGIQIKRKV